MRRRGGGTRGDLPGRDEVAERAEAALERCARFFYGLCVEPDAGELTVSEVGFGLWTISTAWWGKFTEGEAVALMHKAFDLGVTLFDAADTYGNGLSEELIAKTAERRQAYP